jgi:carboxyl-terminal processing protease
MQALSKNTRRYGYSMLLGAIIGVFVAMVFAAGFVFRGVVDVQSILASSGTREDYSLLGEVQSLLNQHYLRQQPSFKEREYAAIRGMLSSLNDRYTFFIEPSVAQSESDVLAGTYGGIGVQVKRSENGGLILYPFAGSPAAAAGIHDGDVLLAINHVSIDVNQPPDAIDQMLRGEVKEGSGVEIAIRSTGEEETIFIPFAVINVPSVLWRTLEDNPQIGYVQVLIFTNRTPQELQGALQDLLKKHIKALVLDLRNNSGGLLPESIAVAEQFLDGGVIMQEKDNQGGRELVGNSGGLAINLPLVVLVNHNTASAAELVAGAIRDRNRGILIGQATFGKGTVQQIYRLSDDSSLHITAAEWLTPNHQHLDGEGLEPTIAMIPDPSGRDIELGEAIRYLDQEYLQRQAP